MDRKYEIGNFICRLRNEKGYTQKELGALLGVTDKAVSKWENGASLPRKEVLRRLAAILGCTQEELLQGSRTEKPVADAHGPCEIPRESEVYGKKVQPGRLTEEAKRGRAVIWKIGLCVFVILALLIGCFGFQKGIWNGTEFFRVSAQDEQIAYSGRSGDSVTIRLEGELGELAIRSKEGKSAQLRFLTSESGAAQSLTILTADGAPILSKSYYKQTEDPDALQGGHLIADHIWNTNGWYPGLPDQSICRMALRLNQTRLWGRAEDFSMGLLFAALGFLICFFMDALIRLDLWFLGFFYRHADQLHASRLMRGFIGISGIVAFACGLILCGSVLFG